MQTVQLVKPRGNPVARALWRYFVTGRPIIGAGDNASFRLDATTDYRDGPVEKLTRARWRRVARRHAAITVPGALALCDWRLLIGYALLAICAGAGFATRALAAWWPQRATRREYVIPTWFVVARILGVPARRREAIRAVALPPGFGTEDAPDEELVVRIHLPTVALDEGTQKRIAVAAGQRLGMPDPSASWAIRGAHAHVDISPRAQVPRTVAFADVRALWMDASPTKPLCGLGSKRVPVYADLDNDGPHIGVSGGTGTGKSTLLRVILSKRVQSGAGLVVCDYKVTSHPWARRLDASRCIYVTDEEPISEAILAVFGEFERRRQLLKTNASALEFVRPIDLLVEELNSLADRLRTWWGHERRAILAVEPGTYVPAVPPCLDALAGLVQMGRELGVRVHFAAQRLDAAALSPKGGGAIRESITNRFLAKYTKQAWNMLCAGIPFQAFPGGPRGIWTAVVNGEVTHFRVPPMSNEEAYALAMTGPAPTGPVIGAGKWVPATAVKAVTLGEAWQTLGCTSLDALRQAVHRAKLPHVERRGSAYVYDLRALENVIGRR